ncbi:MAG: hypothetical protein ACE5RH_01960 [Nitrosarchaeum sp.]
MNYEKFFKDRVIIISGVGRSGTTIIGKIVGSMKNCIYFFEPAIMKYFPATEELQDETGAVWSFDIKQAFLATLFEDYILPSVQGRNLNINIQDDSYWGNYQEYSDLRKRFVLTSRLSALKWLEKNDIKFVFKVNESQHLYNVYEDLFEGMKLLYVYRNGIDTVNSMVKKGWYKDDYEPIDLYQTIDGINVPVWVKQNDISNYIKWNQETRCVYAWRILNTMGLDFVCHINDHQLIDYDLIMKEPGSLKSIVSCMEHKYGLVYSDITIKHINSMIDFARSKKQSDLSIVEKIQEPEKSLFLEYNKITSKV